MKEIKEKKEIFNQKLDEIEEKDTPTLSDPESDEEISQDPNIEKFLRQINELKAVCQKQGEALVKFQETVESTKEDNDRLQNVLCELEAVTTRKVEPPLRPRMSQTRKPRSRNMALAHCSSSGSKGGSG